MCALAMQSLKPKTAVFQRSAGHDKSGLRTQELLSQHDFVRLLAVERRRTERSGRPFLLMLLSSTELFASDGDGSSCQQIVNALVESTRDTDIAGWYRETETIGVLFTEISDPATEAASAVLEKIGAAIRHRLGAKIAEHVRISVHIYPETEDNRIAGSDFTLYPDLVRTSETKKTARAIKRAVDLAGSAAALVLLSPFFLVIAAAIKLTSRGPILFRQKRIGQYGQEFTFLKFRSMRANNDSRIHQEYVRKLISGEANLERIDANGNKVFKLANDPRVTRVGRLLRRTSLDELPQFINVLCGQMSLVGPRPPLPYEITEYDIWHCRRLLEAKPGITGLWQVSGRCGLKFDEMVRLDLKYAREASLKLDLQILLRTPRAMITGAGAC